jgi:hypothetical protein
MQTRSQTKRENTIPKYEVNIDFDEASAAWKANKKSIGNGQYKYICVMKIGSKLCRREALKGCDVCKTHNLILDSHINDRILVKEYRLRSDKKLI